MTAPPTPAGAHRRRAGRAAVATALLVLAGCGTSSGSADGGREGGDAAASACGVLVAPLPLDGLGMVGEVPNGPLGDRTGDRLVWLLRGVDDRQATVNVFLEPGAASDELAALDAAVTEQPGVLGTRVVGRDQSYEEFQRLFVGNDEMLANVRPDDLPTSVRAEVAHADVDAFVGWAEDEPGVYEVNDTSDLGTGSIERTLTKQADRDAWTDAAGRLDGVEGDPGWAATSAAVIRQLLADGAEADLEDPAGVTTARQDLEAELAACPD